MTTKKVHITLGKQVLDDPKLMGEVKQNLISKFQMTNVNDRRLTRYGIMSGNLPENVLEQVRGLAEVESLDVDELKFTSD